MRGLTFPNAALYEPADSEDQGTPFSYGDDIPIDPALTGLPLDPALLEEDAKMRRLQVPVQPEPIQQAPVQHHIQYSQGPQGDPFAPQPSYFPVEAPQQSPLKPVKKKRKPRREIVCGFCGGDDARNQYGQAERLISCAECGRSGHPTCMNLAQIDNKIRSYHWQCNDHKTCHICSQGDDKRMLICDACDRGWHMDCFTPPLEQMPPEKENWYCPLCVSPDGQILSEASQSDLFVSCPPDGVREASVASSSRVVLRTQDTKSKKKGKARAAATDESEADMDLLISPTRQSRRKSRYRAKTPSEDEQDMEEVVIAEQGRPNKRPRLRLSSPVPPPPAKPPTIRLRLPPRGKGKEREQETDELQKGMFDDFLSPEDRDTKQTAITETDKQRMERSRVAAEQMPLPQSATSEEPPIAGPSTRPLRSHHNLYLPSLAPSALATPGASTSPAPSTPLSATAHSGAGLRIKSIRFGEYDIQTWFDAPFPEEYMTAPDGRLWICEFCLKYMKSRFSAVRHRMKCKMRHPPGDEIYRDGVISVFEVDGRKNKIYCQNLCLLSKMFLDHKSLFYDVEPFLFYVITEVDDLGSRFVGYFSKEKRSPKDYNVSCIMTLPVRQRQGWGNLLIDFSYLLSKKEHRTGSPEKPLSALGALGYRNYWTLAIMRYLEAAPNDIRLEDISAATSMTIEDICNTLIHLDMISIHDGSPAPRPLPGQSIKFIKGRKNGVARKHLQRQITHDDEKVKGPFIPPSDYDIHWSREDVRQYLAKWEAKGYLKLKPDNLKWSPFLTARTPKSEAVVPDPEGGAQQVPESAVETTAPTPNELVSPQPEVEEPATRNETPVFALFDEEVVEDARTPVRVTSRPNLRSERSSKKSGKAPVAEEDGVPQAFDSSSPSLRRRSNRRPLSETVSPLATRVSPRTVASSRRVRPPTKSSHRRTSIDITADDAALAAQLALEEDRPHRQLRSRSNTEQTAGKGIASLDETSSPRKRKRVHSPSPSPPRTRSQRQTAFVSIPPLTRRSSTKNPSPSKRPKFQRKPSRLPKKVTSPEDLNEGRSSPVGEEGAPANWTRVDSPQPLSAASPHPNNHGHGDNAEPVTNHADIPRERNGDMEANGVAEGVKYEDVGTPLTGVTSRHSVGRSDDTVCAVEEPGKVSPAALLRQLEMPNAAMNAVNSLVAQRRASSTDVDVSPTVVNADNAAENSPVNALKGAMKSVEAAVTSAGPTRTGEDSFKAPGAVEAEGDADADAEGEPDAEGDADAEGEPDDLDAEGEPDEGEIDAYEEVVIEAADLEATRAANHLLHGETRKPHLGTNIYVTDTPGAHIVAEVLPTLKGVSAASLIADGNLDADGDLDAEGEEDIDAEGEPDVGEEIEVDLH